MLWAATLRGPEQPGATCLPRPGLGLGLAAHQGFRSTEVISLADPVAKMCPTARPRALGVLFPWQQVSPWRLQPHPCPPWKQPLHKPSLLNTSPRSSVGTGHVFRKHLHRARSSRHSQRSSKGAPRVQVSTLYLVEFWGIYSTVLFWLKADILFYMSRNQGLGSEQGPDQSLTAGQCGS